MIDEPINPDHKIAESERPKARTFDVIDEALRLQAARRPASSPPKELSMPPTLPKQPKPYRDRKQRRRK